MSDCSAKKKPRRSGTSFPSKNTDLPARTLVVTILVLAALLLTATAAFRATERLIFKAFLFVELLFAFAENKLSVAVFTYQCFVRHLVTPP
jgi:hypothetical protein